MNKPLFLFACFPLLFSSCSNGPGDIDNKQEDVSHINICVLGNSYSADAFCYVPFILKEYGITSSIHLYFRPNGSLENLDMELEIGASNAKHYYIDTRIDTKWRSTAAMKVGDVLSIEKWDYITLQQLSLQVHNEDSYSPYLANVLGRIDDECNYSKSIAWFMSYNRANDSNVEDNLSVQHKIIDNYSFGMVLPVATAIFNCQANEELAKIGDYQYGKFYSKDGIHLQEGLPCYTAALAIVEAILRDNVTTKTVLGDIIRPDQGWINSIGGIDLHGQSVGITESNCLLAQKAAINANDYRFEVVPVK